MKIAAITLGVLGVLAIAAAIVYYTVPAHSLPAFMGTLKAKAHRVKRGEAALIIGIVLLVASIVLGVISARNSRRAAY
jgi:hypothetical protein